MVNILCTYNLGQFILFDKLPLPQPNELWYDHQILCFNCYTKHLTEYLTKCLCHIEMTRMILLTVIFWGIFILISTHFT